MTPTDGAKRAEFIVIESLRGLAAAMVVYTHFWAFSETDNRFFRFAHTGVDLFFVLSGYVFGPYFFGKAINPTGFWIRRFFRIYPLFALALIIYMIQKHLQGQPLLYVFEHLSFSFLQSKTMAFYYNPPFWSLPAEVEFYLLLPVAALIVKAWPLTGIGFFVLALMLRACLGHLADFGSADLWFIVLHHLPGLAVEFCLGIVLWRMSRHSLADRQSALLTSVSLILAGTVGWAALAWHFGNVGDAGINDSVLRGQMGFLAACCYALATGGLLIWIRDIAKAYQSPNHSVTITARYIESVATWSGRLSYGTYLLHMAALQAIVSLEPKIKTILVYDRDLWAVLLTILGAALAHVLWENPLRNLGRNLASQFERRAVKRHQNLPE